MTLIGSEHARARTPGSSGAWPDLDRPAVLLVRHALAVERPRWRGEDDVRPLTAQGRAQADGLVTALAPFPVRRVLSSPSIRCVHTVEPLAAARQVPVEIARVLAEGSAIEACDLVESLAGQAVVVCTHGEVIPEVLEHLVRRHKVDVGPRPSWEKGSTWVLYAENRWYVGSTYLCPPTTTGRAESAGGSERSGARAPR